MSDVITALNLSRHIHTISDADYERGEGVCIDCNEPVVCHDR